MGFAVGPIANHDPRSGNSQTSTSPTALGGSLGWNRANVGDTEGNAAGRAMAGDLRKQAKGIATDPSRRSYGVQNAEVSGPDLRGDRAMAAQQQATADRLSRAADGSGPSIAHAQYQQGLDTAIKSQMGAAAAGNGGALAMRQAQNQAGAMQQAAALQSAQIRAQEQQAAMQQLAALQGQMRAQGMQGTQLEQQAAMANAGFLQQARLATAQDRLNWAQTNDAQARAYNQMAMAQYGADRDATFRAWEMRRRAAEVDNNIERENANQAMTTAMMVGAAMSDERAKTDVRDGTADAREFLEALKAHKYKYRDEVKGAPGVKDGEHVSPMAQELERTSIGKSLVSEGSDGYKRVDYTRAMGTVLSSLGDIHARLKAVEKGRK